MITIVSIAAVCLFLALLFVARRKTTTPAPVQPVEEVIQDTIAADPPPVPFDPVLVEDENILPMASFSIAYEVVRGHERGFQIYPQDRGNRNSLGQLVGTNWGINAQVYETYLGRPPSEQDMRNMPRSTAEAIFKRLYWDRIYGDTIPDQELANIFFDGIVNHGQGVRLMQEVLGVAQDNRYGPVTHAALLAANPRTLHDAYKLRRRQYYHQLVAADSSQRIFLNGWLNRINSFQHTGTSGGGLMVSIGLILFFYALK